MDQQINPWTSSWHDNPRPLNVNVKKRVRDTFGRGDSFVHPSQHLEGENNFDIQGLNILSFYCHLTMTLQIARN